MAQCILIQDSNHFIIITSTFIYTQQIRAYSHIYRQSGLDIKFKLILSANYNSLSDIDQENRPKLRDQKQSSIQTDDSILDGESLESEELSETGKQSVNLTAQYIVYAVIASMALIFAFGICLLIYWWCCHKKYSPNAPITTKANQSLTEIDEATPFIDIRGPNTLKKQNSRKHSDGNELYFEDDQLLQTQRNNVYDTINDGIDDNEDGDELIAHYGSNKSNESTDYVVHKIPTDSLL